MRVVSWNVNGIRACVRHGFVGFCGTGPGADIVGVQEVRARPDRAPPPALHNGLRRWHGVPDANPW